MSHLKIWWFWGYIKSWLHLGSFQMNSGAGALWDEQNVTKIKAIGPCVQELEAKMRVKLALLVVTFFWPGSILPSISPKLWIMRIWFIVHHFPDPWPNYIHQLWTSSYPHLSGGILASDSKARARGAHMLSSKVNQKSLKFDRYFIQVYPWPEHNDGQMKSSSPSYPQLWGF